MSSKTLRASVIIGGSITSAFRGAMAQSRDGLKKIGEAISDVNRRQRLLGNSIDTFGRMGKNVDGLRAKYTALGRESERLRVHQERLMRTQAAMDRNATRRQAIGGQMQGAMLGFGAVVTAAAIPIRQAVAFETAMLGIAKQVEGARDANGNLTAIYYEMARSIQAMGHELPIATNEIADMVTSASRMGIAREDILGFTRDVAMMATAFDAPAAELADNMGKISKIFHLPIKNVSELGDAINYLDDNAISKGSDIIRVLQGDLAGTASTLGLSAKNAAALASTFLTLGESAERADTAASGMMRQLQIAKMNPKRFQRGTEMIGMTGDELQQGMVKDTQGTILKVLDKIKALPQAQQMEAVTRLFGKDWGSAIAKLAGGVDEYRRQLALANGEAQKGSMSREFQSRMKTTAAQWQVFKNRASEVGVAIGATLLPELNHLMAVVGPMATKFATWAAAHPGVIKGVIGTAVALTGLRVVTLGVRYAWLSLKGPVLAVMNFIARWRAAGAISAMGRFGGVALRVVSAVRWVAMAIGAIGGGPITVAIALLVAGALVVRKYWQPIKAFFMGYIEGFKSAVGPAMAELGKALAPLKPQWEAFVKVVSDVWDWFVELIAPVEMTSAELAKAGAAGRSFGEQVGAVMAKVIGAVTFVVKAFVWMATTANTICTTIRNAFASAWEGIKNIVGPAVDWITKRMQPLLIGMRAMGGLGGSVASMFGGGPVPATQGAAALPTTPSARGRKGPNIPTKVGAPGVAGTTQNNTFNITQQQGESSDALAKRILAEQRRQDAVKSRGSLADRGGG